MVPLSCLHAHAHYMRMRRYVYMHGAYAAEICGPNAPKMVCVPVRALVCDPIERDRIESDSTETIDAKPLLHH